MNKTITGLLAFKNLDGLLVSLLGFILILIYTNHAGIGISPDSIVYISGARNLSAHGELMDFSRMPLVDFPVFYPLFLNAVIFLSRIDIVISAPFLNALLFAALIFCTGHLIDSFKENNRFYKITILLSIAICPALISIYCMLWSETLFILLTVLFIVAFMSYLRTYAIASLLLCALIAAVACITRYAGITIIATGLMMMVFDRSLGWRKKMFHCTIFSLFSVSLLIANLIRNRMISGQLTGSREAGITSLRDNIFYYGKEVCSWFPVLGDHPVIYVSISVLLTLMISIVFLKRSWFAENYATAENCFAASFIVYTVFIIGVSTLSHFEQINNRFISPLFIPLLITLTCGIPKALTLLSAPLRKVALVLMSLAILVFVVNELENLKIMNDEAIEYGITGYSDYSWKNSPTSGFIKQHHQVFKPGYDLYSNAPEAIYFNGGLDAILLPHANLPTDVESFYKEKGSYLVWYHADADLAVITVADMQKRVRLVKLYSFKDGDIYFVTPNP